MGGESGAMHNIVDYAIQYSDYAILYSKGVHTTFPRVQRGALGVRQLQLEFCLECQHYPDIQAVLVLPATGSS